MNNSFAVTLLARGEDGGIRLTGVYKFIIVGADPRTSGAILTGGQELSHKLPDRAWMLMMTLAVQYAMANLTSVAVITLGDVVFDRIRSIREAQPLYIETGCLVLDWAIENEEHIRPCTRRFCTLVYIMPFRCCSVTYTRVSRSMTQLH
jgi:hypothetical protein